MVKEQVNQMTIGEGKFSHTGFWKIKKKFSPRPLDPPMAKKDENGHLINSPNLLKELYIDTYKHRLRQRIMQPEIMDIFFLKNELWNSRLEELLAKKSAPWKMDELKKV